MDIPKFNNQTPPLYIYSTLQVIKNLAFLQPVVHKPLGLSAI